MTLTTRQKANAEILSRHIDKDNQYALEEIIKGDLPRAQVYLDAVAKSTRELRAMLDDYAANEA